jgi:hypothetical protein
MPQAYNGTRKGEQRRTRRFQIRVQIRVTNLGRALHAAQIETKIWFEKAVQRNSTVPNCCWLHAGGLKISGNLDPDGNLGTTYAIMDTLIEDEALLFL